MREDLRYIERLLPDYQQHNRHPSKKQIEALKEGSVNAIEKETLLAHLLRCQACSDIYVVGVQQSKKPRVTQPMKKTITAIAAAALLALLIPLGMQDPLALGERKLSDIWQESGYKSPPIQTNNLHKIDFDKVLREIMQITPMAQVPYYKQAQQQAKEGAYEEARGLYKKALIFIRHQDNINLRIRQRIVIEFNLMALETNEAKQTQKSIESYKKMLRYELALYLLKYGKEP